MPKLDKYSSKNFKYIQKATNILNHTHKEKLKEQFKIM